MTHFLRKILLILSFNVNAFCMEPVPSNEPNLILLYLGHDLLPIVLSKLKNIKDIMSLGVTCKKMNADTSTYLKKVACKEYKEVGPVLQALGINYDMDKIEDAKFILNHYQQIRLLSIIGQFINQEEMTSEFFYKDCATFLQKVNLLNLIKNYSASEILDQCNNHFGNNLVTLIQRYLGYYVDSPDFWIRPADLTCLFSIGIDPKYILAILCVQTCPTIERWKKLLTADGQNCSLFQSITLALNGKGMENYPNSYLSMLLDMDKGPEQNILHYILYCPFEKEGGFSGNDFKPIVYTKDILEIKKQILLDLYHAGFSMNSFQYTYVDLQGFLEEPELSVEVRKYTYDLWSYFNSLQN